MKEPIKRALRPFAHHVQSLYVSGTPRKLDDYPIVTSVLIVLAIWYVSAADLSKGVKHWAQEGREGASPAP